MVIEPKASEVGMKVVAPKVPHTNVTQDKVLNTHVPAKATQAEPRSAEDTSSALSTRRETRVHIHPRTANSTATPAIHP